MLQAFSITDIGKRRKLNQDYVFASVCPIGNLPNVFIVADGMGGHNAGDYASRYTVEMMEHQIRLSEQTEPVWILGNAIREANTYIRGMAQENENLFGMGTTVVAATLEDAVLQCANVGDSRLYIIDREEIRQITKDHSLVEEMVRMGGIDKKAARSHPDKNIITRAVGAQDTIEIDFFQVSVTPGDLILLCSDGLTNMLEDEEIREIVSGDGSLSEKGRQLVDAANRNGGKDNIAVILIDSFATWEEK
ncbi:Stp1/IreP family PP2C-type Ser/Thr phosphatase [Lachnospiraceae bacterium JLR.KK008]